MSCASRGIVLRQIDRLFREGTLGGLGDGQLLERYLTRRDETAFEALVDLHGPMVLGLCRRMLRDPRDIEDAFQATFLVLVRKAPTIRDRSLLSSWLYGVAYRVARRARSQTLHRRGRETTVGDLVVAAGPETSDRFEVDPVLDQELNRLPEKYRAPMILCYLRGRTHDQAAEELRCPVGTVRSRLARGRDLLKRRLTRRGFAPPALAAILGTGPSLPVKLLVEAVPPSLVSATLKAAFGFGSAQTMQAGAFAMSALALAQGVLTTMKLTQLKWIGLTILATSLSAGGVVAVSYAAGNATCRGDQFQRRATAYAGEQTQPAEAARIPLRHHRPQKKNGGEAIDGDAGNLVPSDSTPGAEDRRAPEASGASRRQPQPERRRSVHHHFREWQTRRSAARPTPSNTGAEQGSPELLERLRPRSPRPATSPPDRPDIESQRKFPSSAKSIQELEAQLKQVLLERDRIQTSRRETEPSHPACSSKRVAGCLSLWARSKDSMKTLPTRSLRLKLEMAPEERRARESRSAEGRCGRPSPRGTRD